MLTRTDLQILDIVNIADLGVLPARLPPPVLVLHQLPAGDVWPGDEALHAGHVQGQQVQAVQGEEVRPGSEHQLNLNYFRLKVSHRILLSSSVR